MQLLNCQGETYNFHSYLTTLSDISDKTALKCRMNEVMNKKLDMIYKEIFLAYLVKLCLRLPEELKNNKKYIIHKSQNSNTEPQH
jgi:hypothetical protein